MQSKVNQKIYTLDDICDQELTVFAHIYYEEELGQMILHSIDKVHLHSNTNEGPIVIETQKNKLTNIAFDSIDKRIEEIEYELSKKPSIEEEYCKYKGED